MILLLLILLFLSAYFSGLETALFHLKSTNNVNDNIKKLLLRPRKLLSTLITGNTIVNIAIGSLAATYTVNNLSKVYNLSISSLLVIEVILVTAIVLIFGEIIPKTYAISKSEKVANMSAKILGLIIKLIYPIAFVFYKITDLIIRVLPIKKEQIFDSEEELMMLAEVGEEEGTLEHEESDMIQSVLEFKNKLVKEIQTPRVDVVSLDSNSSLDGAMDLIMNKKFSFLFFLRKNTLDSRIPAPVARDTKSSLPRVMALPRLYRWPCPIPCATRHVGARMDLVAGSFGIAENISPSFGENPIAGSSITFGESPGNDGIILARAA